MPSLKFSIVLFSFETSADFDNQINEFMTALKEANLGQEKERKIGLELKSAIDKAAAARAKCASNKNKVTLVEHCNGPPVISIRNGGRLPKIDNKIRMQPAGCVVWPWNKFCWDQIGNLRLLRFKLNFTIS